MNPLHNICEVEGTNLGPTFCGDKSGYMIFNDSQRQPVLIQGSEIDICARVAKYIATNWGRNPAIMKHIIDKVVRVIWKGMTVPGLTFGNAILCIEPQEQANRTETWKN